jgi:hypothetical protein
VLAGVGRMLRLYDLGKRKLLRKCENKVCCRFFLAADLNDRMQCTACLQYLRMGEW